MIIVLTAAALAAQTPPANPPAHSMPMAQGQHEMKKDGCDCCKDMEAKMKEGHHDERGAHGA